MNPKLALAQKGLIRPALKIADLKTLNEGRIKIDPLFEELNAFLVNQEACPKPYDLFFISETISDQEIFEEYRKDGLAVDPIGVSKEICANAQHFITEALQGHGPLYAPGKEVHLILGYTLDSNKILSVWFVEMEEDGECHLHTKQQRNWEKGNSVLFKMPDSSAN